MKKKGKTQYDNIILDEERYKGEVQFDIIKKYFQLFGGYQFYVFLFLCMSLWQGLKMASSIWMQLWTSNDDIS